jgi:DNA-3-methyladenine glycosylase
MYKSKRHKKLNVEFYQRDDVLLIARELMGKLLVTNRNGIYTSGRIVECEAYAGAQDKASHAFAGRRTRRNEPMYADGGIAYVYLCYGIHHLFNVVTHTCNTPHAILIRSVEPVEGINEMLLRTAKIKADHTLTRGPGNVAKALGISTADTGLSLTTGDAIFIANDGHNYTEQDICTSPRIGVDYAGDDALLPYRFYIKGNKYVSGKPK